MRRSSFLRGLLALGVLAALRSQGGLWFGWSGEIAEREPDEPRLIIRDNMTFGTVDMTADDYANHYMGFCNGALWPLFH